MNKLYKYLPFGIDCIQGISSGKRTFGKSYPLQSIFSDYHDYESFEIDVVHFQIKPILYPLSLITQEMPLTRFASEMVGKKENEIIVPLNFMPALIKIQQGRKNIEITSESVADFLRAMHFAVDFSEGEFIPKKI